MFNIYYQKDNSSKDLSDIQLIFHIDLILFENFELIYFNAINNTVDFPYKKTDKLKIK